MDQIAEWEAAQRRVSELVAGLSTEQVQTHVPACPDWTVRDLLSHMVGLGADVLDGDEPDDHNEGWTQAQVDARADRSAAELLEEWDAVAARLPGWMREHGPRPLGDVVIHEQDLRGAVDRPGGRDSDGLHLIRDRMAGRFGDAVEDLPTITLREPGGGWTWCSHDRSVDRAEESEVVVEASGFDLARALMSRRTPDQLRAWTVKGDVEGHLEAFGVLGPLPDQPLPE